MQPIKISRLSDDSNLLIINNNSPQYIPFKEFIECTTKINKDNNIIITVRYKNKDDIEKESSTLPISKDTFNIFTPILSENIKCIYEKEKDENKHNILSFILTLLLLILFFSTIIVAIIYNPKKILNVNDGNIFQN